jgi:two-component sensor histidine kinase
MSLRRRLFLPVLTALLPIVAIEAYNQVELRTAREQELRESAVDRARRVAAEQQRIIDGVHDVLSTLVVLNSVRSQQTVRCNALFAAIRPNFKGFESLVATRADGTPFCVARADSDDKVIHVDVPTVGDRPFFKDAMETKAFVVGGYAREPGTGAHVFHLAMPYFDHAKQPRGVVYVSYDLKWLANRLNGLQWNAGQSFSVIDRDGIILVRQPDWERYVGRPTPSDTWKRVTTAEATFDLEARSPWDGIQRIIGVIPTALGPGHLAVTVGLSHQVAFSSLNDASLREILVVTFGALLAFLLAWMIGLRLVRTPIEGLLETTRRWRNGDLTARTRLSGATEFGQLGEAFDALVRDLEQAMQFKDLLLRELNHRVMNSLQTISALFSLQAPSLRDPEARQKFNDAVRRINSVALAYRRMHTTGGMEAIDFSEYLQEFCAEISRSLMPEGLACRVESDSILLGPQQASSLALIVNELVTNAVKHGDRSTSVEVRFGRSADGCRLAVRNAGALPAGYNPARSPGFGMQMVVMLVDQLGGRLDVSCMASEVEFAVTFAPAVLQPPQLSLVEDRVTTANKTSA